MVVPARVTTPSLLHRVCPVLVALALSPVRVVRARQLRVLEVTVPPARVARALVVTVARVRLPMAARAPLRQLLVLVVLRVPVGLRVPTRA